MASAALAVRNGEDWRDGMEMVRVESSMIGVVAYDDEARELLVVFNTGQTYVYSDVPREVYDNLLRADSKGSYMKDFVIDQYAYRRGLPRRR